MTAKRLPSPELLRKLLSYDPDTGVLTWRVRPVSMFKSTRAANSWNNKLSGKPAFIHRNHGRYLVGAVQSQRLTAHRVIWAMQTGEWPSQEIDHINRVPYDNRWENLREASRCQNMRNKTSVKNSSSSYLGVHWDSNKNRWIAQIKTEEGKTHLGNFRSELDAAAAYDQAARKHYMQFANPNFDQSECLTAL